MQAIKRGSRILGLSLLVSGLLMGYLGCTRTVGAVATWVGGESADGVVTSIRKSPGNPAPAKSPYGELSRITFTTAEGKVVTFEHPVATSSAPFAQGEHVRVVYDADAPQDAMVPRGLALLLLGWGLLAVVSLAGTMAGAALLLVGALPWGHRNKPPGSSSA